MVLMACSAGLCVCLGWRQLSRGSTDSWPAALGCVAAIMGLVCNASFYCTRTRGAFVGLVAGLLFFPLHMRFRRREQLRARSRKRRFPDICTRGDPFDRDVPFFRLAIAYALIAIISSRIPSSHCVWGPVAAYCVIVVLYRRGVFDPSGRTDPFERPRPSLRFLLATVLSAIVATRLPPCHFAWVILAVSSLSVLIYPSPPPRPGRYSSGSRVSMFGVLFAVIVVALNVWLNLWQETSVISRLAKVFVKVERPTDASSSTPAPAKQERKLIGSAYKRMLLYHTAANIIKTYPWLGAGPDAIERVVAKHWARDYQLGNGRLVEVKGFENRIHNEVLDVWASQGILGLFARVWLWVALFKLLWVGARRLSPEDRPVLSGLGAAWVAYVVQNVMAFPTIPISIAVWSLMGCTVAWIQNDGESGGWPTRRWRFSEGAQVWVGMAGLGAAFIVLLCFIIVCLVSPYRADRSFMRGIGAEGRKQRKDAIAFFGQAVELCPRSHIYRERLNQALLKAAAATKERESLAFLEQCVQSSEEMIRVSPWRASGYMTCGSALAAVGQLLATKGTRDADKRKGIECLQRAEAYLCKAVERNPHNRSLRGALIDFYTRRQRWDDAAELLVETYRYWPKDERLPLVIYSVVQHYVNKRQYRKAERLLISVYDVVQDKERAAFGRALATVYRLRGKNEQAVRVSREALATLDREEARLRKLLAPLLKCHDDGADLPRSTIAKMAKDEPGSRAGKLSRHLLRVQAQRPEAHYQLASSLAVMGKLKEAEAECRTALAQSPEHKQAPKLLQAVRMRLSSPN